jgi:hypothetical protein
MGNASAESCCCAAQSLALSHADITEDVVFLNTWCAPLLRITCGLSTSRVLT